MTAPDGEATAQPRLPSPTEAAVAPEKHPRLQGFIKGATAAAAGAIAGAAILISRDVITDGWSVLIALIALAALQQTKVKVPEPALVAVAALVGLIAFS